MLFLWVRLYFWQFRKISKKWLNISGRILDILRRYFITFLTFWDIFDMFGIFWTILDNFLPFWTFFGPFLDLFRTFIGPFLDLFGPFFGPFLPFFGPLNLKIHLWKIIFSDLSHNSQLFMASHYCHSNFVVLNLVPTRHIISARGSLSLFGKSVKIWAEMH